MGFNEEARYSGVSLDMNRNWNVSNNHWNCLVITMPWVDWECGNLPELANDNKRQNEWECWYKISISKYNYWYISFTGCRCPLQSCHWILWWTSALQIKVSGVLLSQYRSTKLFTVRGQHSSRPLKRNKKERWVSRMKTAPGITLSLYMFHCKTAVINKMFGTTDEMILVFSPPGFVIRNTKGLLFFHQ